MFSLFWMFCAKHIPRRICTCKVRRFENSTNDFMTEKNVRKFILLSFYFNIRLQKTQKSPIMKWRIFVIVFDTQGCEMIDPGVFEKTVDILLWQKYTKYWLDSWFNQKKVYKVNEVIMTDQYFIIVLNKRYRIPKGQQWIWTIQRNWQHRVQKTKTNKNKNNPEKLAT